MVWNIAAAALMLAAPAALDSRSGSGVGANDQRVDFHGFSRFDGFTVEKSIETRTVTLTSTTITPRIRWNQLIVSWNCDCPPGCAVEADARVLYTEGPSRYYVLGRWSTDPTLQPRESIAGQKDADGEVDTDTLSLPKDRFGGSIQLRIVLIGAPTGRAPALRYLGLSFSNTRLAQIAVSPNCKAWGKTVDVPQRSQLGYPDQDGWCSPTSTSMVLAWWARALGRPELDVDVPTAARAMYDPVYKGTGNWPFNTAWAGSFAGMRAYVTRFADVSELEDWIAAGIPVVISVSYRLLHGAGKSDSHIAVCVGFTENGDAVINDPWARLEKGETVRVICSRANLVKAWAVSHNTVYLIYPEGAAIPKSTLHHWEQ